MVCTLVGVLCALFLPDDSVGWGQRLLGIAVLLVLASF